MKSQQVFTVFGVKNMYERFEELLKKSGLKISDVARQTGISYSTFTDWKAGRYQPKVVKLQRIADFFGVSIEYLMTGETMPTMALTDEEQGLIWAFRKLNRTGKDMLLTQLRMIGREELYTKDTTAMAIS